MLSSRRLFLTGRTQEIERLERMLEAALHCGPKLLLLEGESGIGKTRLLHELAALARLRGVRVTYGRAHEDISLPYLPYEPLLEWLEHLGPETTPLRLQRLLKGPPPRARVTRVNDAEQERVRLFVEVGAALVSASRRAPSLVILDDLHWFDTASLALLAHLIFAIADAGESEQIPLFLVVAFRRPEPLSALALQLARFQREAICERLQLGGLEEGDVGELLESSGLERASRQLISTIHSASRGNPLFVQALVQELRSAAPQEKRAGFEAIRLDPRELKLPDDVSGSMLSWIGRATPAARELLELGAVLGDTFRLDEIAALGQSAPSRWIGPVEEVVELGILENEADGYRFRHPLLRSACYQRVSPDLRRSRHLQAFNALRERVGGDANQAGLELARHLIAAGPLADPGEAARYAERAGDLATEIYAWGEAARMYQAAAASAIAPSERARLCLAAARRWERSADIGPSLDCYRLAIAHFRQAGDTDGAAEALVERTWIESTRGVELGRLIDVKPLEEALDSIAPEKRELRGRILHALATAHWVATDAASAEGLASSALAIGREVAAPGLCARASGMLALSLVQRLEMQRALEEFESSLRYSQQSGDPWEREERLVRMGTLLISVGRLDRAEETARESLEIARRIDNLRDASIALADLVLLALVRGDFAGVERDAREVVKLARRSHYPWALLWVLPALACARHLLGDDAAAQEAIDLLNAPGRVFDVPGPDVESLASGFTRLLAAHRGLSHPGSSAAKSGARSTRGGRPGALLLYCARVEEAAALRDPELARRCYEPLRYANERGIKLVCGWLLPRMLGVAARLTGAFDQAETHLSDALELGRQLQARPELARTHLELALLLAERRRDGDLDSARDHALRACALFAELAMHGYRARAADLAHGLGAVVPRLREPEAALVQGALVKRAQPQHVESSAFVAADDARVTRVICFTDLEGSTGLMRALGDEKARALLRRHEEITRRCASESGGTEIQHTGDGFLLSFFSASRCIDFATALQQALVPPAGHPEEPSLRLRIGIHVGEPIAEADRLFGAAVNATARVCAAAGAGEIVITELVRALASGRALPISRSERRVLKGFAEPFMLHWLDWSGSEPGNEEAVPCH